MDFTNFRMAADHTDEILTHTVLKGVEKYIFEFCGTQ